jgi:hypothetical protein
MLHTAGLPLPAQESVSIYPVRFNQYYNAFSSINPAMACNDATLEVYLCHNRLLGNLSKIATYFITADMKLSRKTNGNRPYSTAGVFLYTDQEGKYLNRTRFYGHYSWHAFLKGKLKISGGLSLGGMNYSVKGSPLSGDGSDTKADASFGIQLYNHFFRLGFSMSQLFSSALQPLGEVSVLSPFIGIQGEGKVHVNSVLRLRPALSIQIPLSGGVTRYNKVLSDAGFQAEIYERIDLGIALHNTNRMAITAGIVNLFSLSGSFDIYLSYSFPIILRTNLNTPAFEVGAGFSF